MARIELESLSLVTLDKKNIEHLNFFKKLVSDDTITKRFGGLLTMLNNASNLDGTTFNKGYFVLDGDQYIGYIDIGRYAKDEKAVYLRGAIIKEKRRLGYGHIMLDETSNYIFANYPEVKDIKLQTVTDNIEALKTIKSCGFKPISDTLFGKRNPNYEEDKTYNATTNNHTKH